MRERFALIIFGSLAIGLSATAAFAAAQTEALSEEDIAGFCSSFGCDGGPRNCATITIHLGPAGLPIDIEIVCKEP